MDRVKSIIISAVFCLIIAGLTIFHVILPDDEISVSERRKKQQFPDVSVSTLTSGKFMKDFETYLCDQFPLRDALRKIKSAVHFNILRQSDNNSVYVVDGYVSEIDSKLDASSVENFCSKITSLYNKFIKGTHCKVYYSIVPDKNRFLAQANSYPSYDYSEMYSMIDGRFSHMEKIEIESLLSADCYYYTDSHWRQDKIVPVAKKINEQMGMPFNEAQTLVASGDFYGVYHSRAALNIPADKLEYLTNEVINKCSVYNIETKKTGKIYDKEKLEGLDKYDVFLSGPVPFIEITNPLSDRERELVIFRDSFASSLTPLLISSYSKVTVIDTRYILPAALPEYISFDNQDVLFIYSTMFINKSSTLR